ncbi:DUF4244 domain-containing protein [Streptomyces sp. NPDC002676]
MSTKISRTGRVSTAVRAAAAWLRETCRRGAGRDAGMVTSEYAMGIIAAVGFALLLYEVVTSGQVKAELQAIVKRALSARM